MSELQTVPWTSQKVDSSMICVSLNENSATLGFLKTRAVSDRLLNPRVLSPAALLQTFLGLPSAWSHLCGGRGGRHLMTDAVYSIWGSKYGGQRGFVWSCLFGDWLWFSRMCSKDWSGIKPALNFPPPTNPTFSFHPSFQLWRDIEQWQLKPPPPPPAHTDAARL